MSFLDVVAWFSGEPHTTKPKSVSPLLTDVGNDLDRTLALRLRHHLTPVLPLLPGTAGDGHDLARSYLALDWLIRIWAATWADQHSSGRKAAARIRNLPPITDAATARRARQPAMAAIKQAVHARNTAARASMSAAAWEAAVEAVHNNESWMAAHLDTFGDTAYDAAKDAAAETGWHPSTDPKKWSDLDNIIDSTSDAATALAVLNEHAVTTTIATLQESAVDLYRRMAQVGRTAGSA